MTKTDSTLYLDELWSMSAFGGDTLKIYEKKEGDVIEGFSRVRVMMYDYGVPRLMVLRGVDDQFRVYSLVGKVRRVTPMNYVSEYPLYRLEEVCDGEREVGVGYDRLRDEYFITLSGWHGLDGYTATLDEVWRYLEDEGIEFKVRK